MEQRHDDPLTQMGVQLVTAELKMGCDILIEVGDATLQDLLQGRVVLEEKQKRTDH